MLERPLERFLFASRWIQAPLYAGLTLLLVGFVAKFFQEVWHSAANLIECARRIWC